MGDAEGVSGNRTVAGDGSGDEVKINIRCSNGVKFSVRTGLESTVGAFKTLVAQNCDIPANQQRLIYKGRILKDDETLQSYGLQEEHSVHVVRGFVPDASINTSSVGTLPGDPNSNSSSVGTPTPGVPNSIPGVATGVSSTGSQGFGGGLASLFPGLDGSALGGNGESILFGDGLPGLRQVHQQILRNPNLMNEIMNMPLFQNVLNNPNTLRDLVMNNPEMREVIDRNPQLAQVLNDPSTLRQTMEIARNPELMREMMRNTDRAMSNIESLPEGFNMLRRMYENVQEPLLSATSMSGNNENGPGSNLFAALLGNQMREQVEDRSTTPSTMSSNANSGSSVPNANPLPNPWSNATRGAQTNNTTRTNRTGGANVAGIGGFGEQGLSGLDTQSNGLISPSTMIQFLQNPAVTQRMNQLMADSNPQERETMQNPHLLPSQLPTPERLQEAMAALSSLLFGSQSHQSPLGTGQTGRVAVPPEELYANQLSQLQEMGFIDTRENIQALLATSGNVHAAVERLLQNLGQ